MTLSAVISGQLFNLFYGEHLTFSSVFSSHFFFPWQCNDASLAVPKKIIHTPGTGYLHSLIRQNQNYDERKKDRCRMNAYQLISNGKVFLL